jgi:hypothetical protein
VLVCEACQVREECFEFGLFEHWGIWGGAPERQRRNYRTKHGLRRPVNALRASRRAS